MDVKVGGPGDWVHAPRGVACPKCSAALVLHSFAFFAYLDGYRWPPDRGHATCGACGHFFDLWSVLLESLKFPDFPSLALAEGVRSTGTVVLPVNEVTVVHLVEYGIPETARVLASYATPVLARPDAHVTCHLPMANRIVPPVGFDHSVPVLVRTEDRDYDAVKVSMLVSWIPKDEDTEPYARLLDDAFDALQQGDHTKTLLLAHTALDFVLERVVLECLNRSWPGPSFKPGPGVNYLQKLATLEALGRHYGLPALRPHILEIACALNAERNKGVHPRKVTEPLTRDRVAELLCAAVFTVLHVEATGRSLLGVQSLWSETSG